MADEIPNDCRGAPSPPGSRMIAVAIMAKVPIPGAVKTRLCPPLHPDEAATLAGCFLQDRVDQLAALPQGEPMVAFTPPGEAAAVRRLVPPPIRLIPQSGEDLGARLDRVLTDLLAEGYTGAIAVDADSPTLPSAYLEAACRHLEEGRADVVVGPSEDGGYYLIGLRQPAPALFRTMAWSTPAVLPETLARVGEARLRLHLLPAWFDVDRGADLERLLAATPPKAFRPRRTLAFLSTWAGRRA